jgi:hypothetical protein
MNGAGLAKPRSKEEKETSKIIIFTTYFGMCFSSMDLDECMVVVTHSHEHLHTQEITNLSTTQCPFLS